MANVFNLIEFCSNVLDRRSPLQKLVGPNVHLKGWEATDLKVLGDKVVGFLVVLDGCKAHITINKLLVDDSISQFHIDPIQLFLPSDCFPYRVRLLLYEWGPFTLIACVLAVGLLLRLKEWCASAPPRRSLAEAVKDGLLDWTPAALVIVFMAVPLTSAYTLQAPALCR